MIFASQKRLFCFSNLHKRLNLVRLVLCQLESCCWIRASVCEEKSRGRKENGVLLFPHLCRTIEKTCSLFYAFVQFVLNYRTDYPASACDFLFQTFFKMPIQSVQETSYLRVFCFFSIVQHEFSMRHVRKAENCVLLKDGLETAAVGSVSSKSQ